MTFPTSDDPFRHLSFDKDSTSNELENDASVFWEKSKTTLRSIRLFLILVAIGVLLFAIGEFYFLLTIVFSTVEVHNFLPVLLIIYYLFVVTLFLALSFFLWKQARTLKILDQQFSSKVTSESLMIQLKIYQLTLAYLAIAAIFSTIFRFLYLE